MEYFPASGILFLCAWTIATILAYDFIRRSLWLARGSGRQAERTDSAQQLRWVMAAQFSARRVMSLAEYRVFKEVESEVQSWRAGHRVFSQTSLGEVLRSEDRRAHSAINSKRVDVLVVARDGLPVLVVEYQGAGHYQGDAAARDAVKREALRKAGVVYLEVFASDQPSAIRSRVRDALRPVAVAS